VYVSDGGVSTGTTEVAHPPVTVSDGGHARKLLPRAARRRERGATLGAYGVWSRCTRNRALG
jgi:hypothetical protein